VNAPIKVALLAACDLCGSAVDEDQGMCARCRAPNGSVRPVAPFDVVILSPHGAPYAARMASGEWLSLRTDRALLRVTAAACEHIAARAPTMSGYRVVACPTVAAEALALLCSAVIASYDAAARDLPTHARAHAALAMMLAVAAEQAGADTATIAACSAAARAAIRSSEAAPLTRTMSPAEHARYRRTVS
jgi:hypothetical protein